jgi:hypothetical protein
MPAEDRFTLGELKKLIKEHMKTTPKLSSGKQNLLLYADKAGLLKKKEAPVEVKKAELPMDLKKPVKDLGEAKKISKELPETLKKAKAEPVKAKAEPVKAKKAPTGFAAFMSANKGKGLSMSQMSQMYRDSKE